jgi:NAD(P)-dependent dehydrogenase (short-subunit alcohol dehydrogenase family)
MSRTVTLVTGANQGLGFETARRLAALGHHVIVGARTAEKAQEAAAKLAGAGSVEGLVLDVTRPADHARAAATIGERHGRLDVLVNNAGIIQGEGWMGNSTLTVPMDTLRATFETNFFGLVGLTTALVPLLRKSAAGRVVNVSSVMGSLGAHAKGGPIEAVKPFAYDASKTALNAFTVHLAQALEADGIKVNSAHPGWAKTALGGDWAPMTVEEGAETIVQLATLPADGATGGFFHRGDSVPW